MYKVHFFKSDRLFVFMLLDTNGVMFSIVATKNKTPEASTNQYVGVPNLNTEQNLSIFSNLLEFS